jgi:GntR family transcriptional regulator
MPEIERAIPPYQQIADHLRAQIRDGELRPGDVLPSERQIMQQWNVARATAGKALNALRLEGLVEVRRGVGTVVREFSPLYRRVGTRYAHQRRTGLIYNDNEFSRLEAAEMVPASEQVAMALNLDPGDPVMHRRRVTLADNAPVEISSSFFDGKLAELCPRILERDRIPEGTAAYVEAKTGRRGATARDRVWARIATGDEAGLLAEDVRNLLPGGRRVLSRELPAVLCTAHTLWDADGEPLMYEFAISPYPHWTEYMYELE